MNTVLYIKGFTVEAFWHVWLCDDKVNNMRIH